MKHHETLEHSPFDATISALGTATSALGVETSAIGAETSAQRHQRSLGVSGDCGVGITRRCVTELLITQIRVLFSNLCLNNISPRLVSTSPLPAARSWMLMPR